LRPAGRRSSSMPPGAGLRTEARAGHLSSRGLSQRVPTFVVRPVTRENVERTVHVRDAALRGKPSQRLQPEAVVTGSYACVLDLWPELSSLLTEPMATTSVLRMMRCQGSELFVGCISLLHCLSEAVHDVFVCEVIDTLDLVPILGGFPKLIEAILVIRCELREFNRLLLSVMVQSLPNPAHRFHCGVGQACKRGKRRQRSSLTNRLRKRARACEHVAQVGMVRGAIRSGQRFHSGASSGTGTEKHRPQQFEFVLEKRRAYVLVRRRQETPPRPIPLFPSRPALPFPVLAVPPLAPNTPLCAVLEGLILKLRIAGQPLVDKGRKLQHGVRRCPAVTHRQLRHGAKNHSVRAIGTNLSVPSELVRAHRKVRRLPLRITPPLDTSSSTELASGLPRFEGSVHPEKLERTHPRIPRVLTISR